MSVSTIVGTQAPRRAHAVHAGSRSYKRFFGHLGEMMAAMLLGMFAGGMLGVGDLSDPVIEAVLWLVAMVGPMAAWMRFRGMTWRQATEMSIAMAVPTLAALLALWGGAITSRTVNSIEHGAMAPAMLALMIYRRRQYGL